MARVYRGWILDNTKLVIVYGECKDRIYDELISMNMNTIKVNNLKEAVEVAYMMNLLV